MIKLIGEIETCYKNAFTFLTMPASGHVRMKIKFNEHGHYSFFCALNSEYKPRLHCSMANKKVRMGQFSDLDGKWYECKNNIDVPLGKMIILDFYYGKMTMIKINDIWENYSDLSYNIELKGSDRIAFGDIYNLKFLPDHGQVVEILELKINGRYTEKDENIYHVQKPRVLDKTMFK